MRKISSILLCFVFVIAFSASACADIEGVVRPSIEVKEISVVAGTLIEADSPETAADGTIVKYYDLPEVYITPYAQKDEIPYSRLSDKRKAVIKENLEEAYNRLLPLKTLGEVNSLLEDRAREINPEYNSWVFVASDIFDISLDEAEEKRLAENEDLYFRLTISLTHPVDSVKDIAVMHCPQSTKEWKLLPEEDVILNEDGTLTLIFDSLCPVVVMVAQPERMQEYQQQSEENSHTGVCKCPSWCPFCSLFCGKGNCYCLLALIILLLLIATLVIVIIVYCNKMAKDKARKDNFNRIMSENIALKRNRKE